MKDSKYVQKLLVLCVVMLTIQTTEHLLDEYTIHEIIEIDFPDIHQIITKAELLDYLLRRFVHSNLKQARVFHFKFQILEQKIEYYKTMQEKDKLPQDFEKIMKEQTLDKIEKTPKKGRSNGR